MIASLKETDHSEDLGVEEKITLTLTCRKQGERE
jgi:hypothetical protein